MRGPEFGEINIGEALSHVRPLPNSIWTNRERILTEGVLVTISPAILLSQLAYGGTGREMIPQLVDPATNLLKASVVPGALLALSLIARLVGKVGSAYLETLKDIHGHH